MFRFLKDNADVTEKVVTMEEMRDAGGGDQDAMPEAEAAEAAETPEPLAVEQTATPKRRGRKAASEEA